MKNRIAKITTITTTTNSTTVLSVMEILLDRQNCIPDWEMQIVGLRRGSLGRSSFPLVQYVAQLCAVPKVSHHVLGVLKREVNIFFLTVYIVMGDPPAPPILGSVDRYVIQDILHNILGMPKS